MKESFIVFLTFPVLRLDGKEDYGRLLNMRIKPRIFSRLRRNLVEKIYKAKSADEAKRIANANSDKYPKDWEKKNIAVMEDILRHKLNQNPYVKA